ncbi:hypothetical protein D3C72_606900 [compost metagenome]
MDIARKVELRLARADQRGVALDQPDIAVFVLDPRIGSHFDFTVLDSVKHPATPVVVRWPIEGRLLGMSKQNEAVVSVAIELL